VRVDQSASDPIVIEVGQPVRHRFRIAAEFLIAIMMPLLLLLLAGWVIVWRRLRDDGGRNSRSRQRRRDAEPSFRCALSPGKHSYSTGARTGVGRHRQ
jgi:hypothetical protein